MANRLSILSVMSELGAGTRGSSLGLDALKMASIKYDIDFFSNYPISTVATESEVLFKETPYNCALRVDGIKDMYHHIQKDVSNHLKSNQFPVVIAGDHSNAGGTISGIKTAFPNKRLGVIWIDAHADLHSPFTSPSGNVHGMPLATAIHEDNTECQINEPDENTLMFWNEMKGDKQRLKPSDLFFIGVRDTEHPEEHLMEKYNIPNVKVEDLRKVGSKEVASQAMRHLQDCDLIYISFDVDSMDPSISKGTGTPVPGGLTEEEAGSLISYLLDDERVCCFEITEINPLLDDRGNAMAEAAFRILKPTVEKIVDQLN